MLSFRQPFRLRVFLMAFLCDTVDRDTFYEQQVSHTHILIIFMSQNIQKSELCLEYSLFLQNYIVTLHHLLIYN